jgi:hypothetical protein
MTSVINALSLLCLLGSETVNGGCTRKMQGWVALVWLLMATAHAAEKGTVKIVTVPGEAQITVNGERKGASPAEVGQTFAIKLDQGDYTIEASKNGRSEKKQVFVASDTLQTITFTLGKMISGRYLDNGDGTVTDTKTNLMWKQCAEGQSGSTCSGKAAGYQWDAAIAILNDL